MIITAIFVAAGSSTRMGAANKLLLTYNKATLIEHTFSELQKSLVDQIVVVTGFEASKIKKVLPQQNLLFAHNPNYKTGLTSSIQTGVKKNTTQFDAYMVTLADMPFLTYQDYNKVLNTFKSNYKASPLIVVPQVGQRYGNPVIFSKELKTEILTHQKLEGCKAIIQKNNKFVKKVELYNPIAFNDIDRPEDYQKLINVRVKPGN